MPYLERHRIILPVSTSGGASQAFYTARPVAGFVEAFVLTKPGASFISSGAGLLITAELSSNRIFGGTATGGSATSVAYYPLAGAVNTSNVVIPVVASGDTTAIWSVKIPVANERVKVQITSAGAASGVFSTGNFIDLYISGF